MFYDKFIALCERDGVSPSKVMTDNGFNKATVSMWKRKYLQQERAVHQTTPTTE